MNTQTHTTDTVAGKLKRIAGDIIGLNRPDGHSADSPPSAMPIPAPPSPADETLSSGNTPTAEATPKGSVGEFKPMSEYALSVAMKEATRGYGKKAGSGNKNIIYVDVDGWEGLAICRVSDREQWRPHDRLTGTFVRLTPDYLLEFAYLPGRRVGRAAR
jgi:hypothetical protein